ncbi:MAG: 3-phosphoshikimate 1-carboxyvinyltransferase [Candidatus Faecousia sp.]|nr:3-phosphoshikimate 1-carboxyvinyltransferase [Candidatus Faecousia sp.]
MDICITPKKLYGNINAIPSKSQAHRMLICAAFSDQPTTLICPETNRDIEATANCLTALGAGITWLSNGYRVKPIEEVPFRASLLCQDSGSTLRFLLPIAGALGVDTVFQMTGRLPQRPLTPLWEEMERMGCTLTRPTADTIRCTGRLRSGEYAINGTVSSQFITGLLFALSLLPGQSRLQVLGKLESAPYVSMTLAAMERFGISCNDYCFPGNGRFHSPGTVTVEGDWSNAAFFLAAQALGSPIQVGNLNPDSTQGDRACARLLPALKDKLTISAADIPDLVPILAVTAAANQGAVFTDIGRLRLKESDRVASVMDMLRALGGQAEADDTTLTVYGTGLHGGTVDSHNDHRIAMSAAIAATVCDSPVTILGAQCVEKSYPKFFTDYTSLGGQYEQYLR